MLNLKGLPDIGRVSMNCTTLYASRHWKLERIQPIYKKHDMQVELVGLAKKGVDSIIQTILRSQTELAFDSTEFKIKCTELKTQIEKSEASMKVPMFVTMSVFLLLHGKYMQESVTGLALDQLELLIQRAEKRDDIPKNATGTVEESVGSTIDVPEIIQINTSLSKVIAVLFKLGKEAFMDLISNETRLVFEREKLEDGLGKVELEIALKVGIVSQMRAPGFPNVPKVSIEFLHKSMQEAMAALYIVCDKPDAFLSLCKYCNTVDKVMQMSNMLNYMAGISPSIICKFSKHIVLLATSDQEIMKEREEIKLPLGR